jgi:uncharacterized protein (TIGR00255 family)
MTGYGKAEIHSEKIRGKVEIKTLNGKFIEINLRTPRQLSEKEIYLRNFFTKNIVRGSVLAIIQIKKLVQTKDELAFNKTLANEYYKAFKDFADEAGANSDNIMASVLSAPEVMASREDGIDPNDWKDIQNACEAAFQELDKFRQKEGETLRKMLIGHCEEIISCIPQVEAHEADRKAKMIEKIKSALQDNMLNESYDANRMEQELIYYLEKLDIAEEKNRLNEHCKLFMEEINGNVSGKKLGFISQEMGREINTMGSKANFAPIQKIVVSMKEELEKIKEQSFNIV